MRVQIELTAQAHNASRLNWPTVYSLNIQINKITYIFKNKHIRPKHEYGFYANCMNVTMSVIVRQSIVSPRNLHVQLAKHSPKYRTTIGKICFS